MGSPTWGCCSLCWSPSFPNLQPSKLLQIFVPFKNVYTTTIFLQNSLILAFTMTFSIIHFFQFPNRLQFQMPPISYFYGKDWTEWEYSNHASVHFPTYQIWWSSSFHTRIGLSCILIFILKRLYHMFSFVYQPIILWMKIGLRVHAPTAFPHSCCIQVSLSDNLEQNNSSLTRDVTSNCNSFWKLNSARQYARAYVAACMHTESVLIDLAYAFRWIQRH